MDVRQLKVLLAVMESGGLGKAADRLHMSQPALTKIIHRLEDELGVKLFRRRARGMEPTIYADILRLHAQNATSSLAQAAREIEALRDGIEETVSVASSPVIGGEILPEAIMRLANRNPRIVVRVAMEPTESLHHLVSDEQFDFVVGVLGEVLPRKSLQQQLLFYDKLVIVARRGHPLTKLPHVRPRDLVKQSWIAPDERSLNRHRLQHLFDAWKLPLPRVAIECRSPALAKKLLLRTDYVCLLAKLAAYAELQSRDLATIEIDGANFDRPVGLLWPKAKALSSGARALIQEIVAVCDAKGLAKRPQISQPESVSRV